MAPFVFVVLVVALGLGLLGGLGGSVHRLVSKIRPGGRCRQVCVRFRGRDVGRSRDARASGARRRDDCGADDRAAVPRPHRRSRPCRRRRAGRAGVAAPAVVAGAAGEPSPFGQRAAPGPLRRDVGDAHRRTAAGGSLSRRPHRERALGRSKPPVRSAGVGDGRVLLAQRARGEARDRAPDPSRRRDRFRAPCRRSCATGA